MLLRGAWVVAQSVRRPTLAQVMTSWFTNSSPVSGSMLTAQSLEREFCVSISLSPSPTHLCVHVCLSLKK